MSQPTKDMHLFLAAQFPVYFTAVYVVGFVAAVGIGSIAWRMSKRPLGWQENNNPANSNNGKQP